MKKIIIILGCVVLGCIIFNMLVGDDDTSFKSAQKKVMQKQIESYKYEE